jgi:hypothetical protein
MAKHQMTTAIKGCGRGPRGHRAPLPDTSRCPVPGCCAQIDPTRLMCRHHWYQVPKQVRDQVWATWRSGTGASSFEHEQAVGMAITACQDAAPGAGHVLARVIGRSGAGPAEIESTARGLVSGPFRLRGGE